VYFASSSCLTVYAYSFSFLELNPAFFKSLALNSAKRIECVSNFAFFRSIGRYPISLSSFVETPAFFRSFKVYSAFLISLAGKFKK
jgi:hypothetical protein